MTKKFPDKLTNRDAQAGTMAGNIITRAGKRVVATAKKYPKSAAALASAATLGPIPTALGAAALAALKNRKKIGGVTKKIMKRIRR